MPITSQVDQSRQLTVFTGKGEVSFDQVRTAIDAFYEGSHTLKVLWDLRDALVAGITMEQVEQLANLLQKHGGVRKGVRTGIVAPIDLDYGLSRMLISLLETKEQPLPVRMSVFREFEDAMKWLQTD